jgi:hypothetical protein
VRSESILQAEEPPLASQEILLFHLDGGVSDSGFLTRDLVVGDNEACVHTCEVGDIVGIVTSNEESVTFDCRVILVIPVKPN